MYRTFSIEQKQNYNFKLHFCLIRVRNINYEKLNFILLIRVRVSIKKKYIRSNMKVFPVWCALFKNMCKIELLFLYIRSFALFEKYGMCTSTQNLRQTIPILHFQIPHC